MDSLSEEMRKADSYTEELVSEWAEEVEELEAMIKDYRRRLEILQL